MSFFIYYRRVLKTAFARAFDRAQGLLFLFFLIASIGAATSKDDTGVLWDRVRDVVVSWQGAALVLGSIITTRLVMAPYLMWLEDHGALANPKAREAYDNVCILAGLISELMCCKVTTEAEWKAWNVSYQRMIAAIPRLKPMLSPHDFLFVSHLPTPNPPVNYADRFNEEHNKAWLQLYVLHPRLQKIAEQMAARSLAVEAS